MARPGSDEKAEKVIMVTESDKTKFDKLCDAHSWTHWRMFREILGAYIAQQEADPAATT